MSHRRPRVAIAAGVVSTLLLFCVVASGLAIDITVNPAVTFSASGLTFGLTDVFVAAPPQSTTATNVSPFNVRISDVSLIGANVADFSVANGCVGDLAPGATCFITVGFTPRVSGTRSATVQVTSAPGHHYTVALTGSGHATPTGITLTSVLPSVPDDSAAGTRIAVANVTMSDGGACAGPPACTLTTSDTNIYAISGLNVVTARQLVPADDGSHPTTITAH